MSQPRKHHYLSQFYMRGFSIDGNRIAQMEKRTGRAYELAVRDAAAIRDFHELDHPDFKDANALEKELSKAESKYAEILVNVIANGIDDSEHHARLIEFMNLMRVRVPAQVAQIESSLKQTLRSMAKMLERHGELPESGQPGVSLVDGVEFSIKNFALMEFMLRLAADPDILALFTSMSIEILDAGPDEMFLTCDQPVATYHPNATRSDSHGVGLIDRATEISFPLSSRCLLRLTWREDPYCRRAATAAEVKEMNRRTIIMANSYVFTDRVSGVVGDEINRFSGQFAGMEFETIDRGEAIFQVARNRAVMAPDQYE